MALAVWRISSAMSVKNEAIVLSARLHIRAPEDIL
jgi:hypothetical protein